MNTKMKLAHTGDTHGLTLLSHVEEGEWLTILHLIQVQALLKCWLGIEFT